MADTKGTAGAVPVDISDAFKDLGNSKSGASGGTIKNGMIVNSSGSQIGIVKMLALGAFGLIVYRLFFKKGGK